jgi:hypothetical protein
MPMMRSVKKNAEATIGKESGSREFRLGMRHLAAKRPDLAVKSLRVSVETCPAVESSMLSRRLYWLGAALFRLDRPELALKSLASAQKLRPRGLARRIYVLRTNEYGMMRRSKAELDDFYAFYSIKLGEYFRRKGEARFSDCSEKDFVVKMIGDAWLALSRSKAIKDWGTGTKLDLFMRWPVAFPSFGIRPGSMRATVRADFRRGARLRGADRCPCGSGLSFARCCGRTAGPGELTCE